MEEIIDEAPDFEDVSEVVEIPPRTWDDVISENSTKFHKWTKHWELTLGKHGFYSLWRYCNMVYGFNVVKFDNDWEAKYPYLDDNNCDLRASIREHTGEDAEGIIKMLEDLCDVAEEPPKT